MSADVTKPICLKATMLLFKIFLMYEYIFAFTGEIPWKAAVFSQYPRPSDYPQEDSDRPDLVNITIMGYASVFQSHNLFC